jgi:hypothetical protein
MTAAEQELRQVRDELEALRTKLASIKSTVSWRATAPFRKALRFLRRLLAIKMRAKLQAVVRHPIDREARRAKRQLIIRGQWFRRLSRDGLTAGGIGVG